MELWHERQTFNLVGSRGGRNHRVPLPGAPHPPTQGPSTAHYECEHHQGCLPDHDEYQRAPGDTPVSLPSPAPGEESFHTLEDPALAECGKSRERRAPAREAIKPATAGTTCADR